MLVSVSDLQRAGLEVTHTRGQVRDQGEPCWNRLLDGYTRAPENRLNLFGDGHPTNRCDVLQQARVIRVHHDHDVPGVGGRRIAGDCGDALTYRRGHISGEPNRGSGRGVDQRNQCD